MKPAWLTTLGRRCFRGYDKRTTRNRNPRSRRAGLVIEPLEDRTLLAVSVVPLVSDANVLFETDNQGMFGPGSGAAISESVDLTLLDIDIDGSSIGGFGAGTGAEITIHDGNITLGVRASVDVNPGQVDVDYQADIKIAATGAENITAGQVFTIDTGQLVDTAVMATDFPDITASLSTFADIDVRVDVLAKLFGATILDTSIRANTHGEDVAEIISLTVGQSSGIQVGLAGLPLELAEESVDLEFLPEPLDDYLSATLFVPELDTAPDDSSIFIPNDGVIINLHFRESHGEGNQVLEERPQFAVVGAVRQSG